MELKTNILLLQGALYQQIKCSKQYLPIKEIAEVLKDALEPEEIEALINEL